MIDHRIIRPGRNCWRRSGADRVSVLIDGKAYFGAFREALKRARRSVMIIGWDIDSRMKLVRDESSDDLPVRLGEFIQSLVRRNRKLHIYILIWDFAMIYAGEREWIPMFRPYWRRHRRVHFIMDSMHPLGASQHQKLVVVDDRLAFCGGFDLSKWRWDTPDHRSKDPMRVDPDGATYKPFHDVQMMVDGEAAAALAELARERWKTAGGRRCVSGDTRNDPWPHDVMPDFRNVDVAIARTMPPYAGRTAVREIEQLYLDSIAAARRNIYAENQYLTSHRVVDALIDRLTEPSGPDILIVLMRETGGWLEQHTMDVLRGRLLEKLRAADKGDRLRVCYPDIPGSGDDLCVKVHSKLMIIDDNLLRVGSSNISNRSMGLDSECDLVIEATSDEQRQHIAAIRDRLLGEHLGVSGEEVAQAMTETGSLIATVDRLAGSERTLSALDGRVPDDIDRQVPDSAVIDPERPVAAEDLAAEFIRSGDVEPARRHIAIPVAVLVIALSLAAAWRWTPLGEWLDPQTMQAVLNAVADSPFALLLVLCIYVIGGLLIMPVSVLIMATGLAFGTWAGIFYALVGATASAAVTYVVGRITGRDVIGRFAGPRVNQLGKRLARRGILTVVALRIVPIAPFTIINMVAGASHIRFRDFIIGNAVGLIPGVLAIVFFVDRIIAALHTPGWTEFLVLAAAVLVIVVATWALRRWLRKAVGSGGEMAQRDR